VRCTELCCEKVAARQAIRSCTMSSGVGAEVPSVFSCIATRARGPFLCVSCVAVLEAFLAGTGLAFGSGFLAIASGLHSCQGQFMPNVRSRSLGSPVSFPRLDQMFF